MKAAAPKKKVVAKPATAVNLPAPIVPAPKTALVQPVLPDTMSPSAGSMPLGSRVRTYNRWRERYNPLRGLNMARAVTLLEQYQRGEMADPQWAYFFVEQRDPDLFAILERRESGLLELGWNVKPISGRWSKDDPRLKTWDQALADDQGAALNEAYEGVDNLYEAFSHLQLATFRGFSHLEKYRNADGDIYHLQVVDQWNMVRDLLRGAWKYNPQANATTFYGLSADMLVDPADFIIRERDRHVDQIALLKFIRSSLSEKDWDAFIEIYGIPSGVVTGPPNVPVGKEEEYKRAAGDIAEGGSGYLPHGSSYTPNDGPRGNSPFKVRLDHLTEKLVLAGTGGLLTMLTHSGSGTLAGSAHADAFKSIVASEARKISEIFQRQFDAEILNNKFPGQDHLVYFELASKEESQPGAAADLINKLAQAGYDVDLAQASEATGLDLSQRPPVNKTVIRAAAGDPTQTDPRQQLNNQPIANRSAADETALNDFLAKAKATLVAADALDLKHIVDRVEQLLAMNDDADPQVFHAALAKLIADLPALGEADKASPAALTAWKNVLSAAAVNGLTIPPEKSK